MTRTATSLTLATLLGTMSGIACASEPATIRISGDEANDVASGGVAEYAFLEQQSLSPDELEEVWAGLPCERISMSRGSCATGCPAYDVTFIRGSGDEGRASVLYDGSANVEVTGTREGTASVRDFARLCQLVDHLGFMQLDSEYRAEWQGDATTAVRVNHRTGAHEVSDYGDQGPPGLVALELAIDGCARAVTWSDSLE